ELLGAGLPREVDLCLAPAELLDERENLAGVEHLVQHLVELVAELLVLLAEDVAAAAELLLAVDRIHKRLQRLDALDVPGLPVDGEAGQREGVDAAAAQGLDQARSVIQDRDVLDADLLRMRFLDGA